ncbi:phospholipid scramblase 1-like [Ornithodoros turicata]|uniref:phospholipid scramblase 1-like n=1 Tax=Ornithodoros turicata TaxID=34597 RepID=UPI003138BF2A
MMRLTSCAPGLEYLETVDQLIIRQKVELIEVLTGFETANAYVVVNNEGQELFYATEESDICTRNGCGTLRPFTMALRDVSGSDIIHMNRPLRCDSCWCSWCVQSMEVSSPPGYIIGHVEQQRGALRPTFLVQDAERHTRFIVVGPHFHWCCCGDVPFRVLSPPHNKEVGLISKQWSGLLKELLTDADTFGVCFPMDLDAKLKAVVIATAFLIDFLFFEKPANLDRCRLLGIL